MLAIPIFLPLISGFVLYLLATAGHKWQEGITKKLSVVVMGIVLLTAVFHGINLYEKSAAVTIWETSGNYTQKTVHLSNICWAETFWQVRQTKIPSVLGRYFH